MKRIVKYAMAVLLFCGGLLILLYPTISNYWNQNRYEKLLTTYEQRVEEEDKSYDEEFAAASAYNATLIGSTVPDAFSSREDVRDPEYEGLVVAGDDLLMGSIEIPSIRLKLPVYHYTKEEMLKKGVGHLFGSSLPVGGESTHAVLSAHRGLPDAKLFTDLNLLEVKDVIYIKIYDEILAYEVDQIKEVEPSETEDLAIEEGKDYITLVTCTPYAVNTHRLLVRGHRISYEEDEYHQQVERKSPWRDTVLWIQIGCVVLGISIPVIVYKFCQRRSRRRGRRYGR